MIVLIDFYADWCGPCQSLKPVLEKVVKDYEGKVSMEKVNVDENHDKAQEFGVMSIPTLVITKDGKEVGRKTGLVSESDLRSWLDKNLS